VKLNPRTIGFDLIVWIPEKVTPIEKS